MRFEGTLVQWNEDRGFGFVQPAQGGQNLFVHVSAFPRGGRRPQLNERLSFEVAPGQNGKKQAVAVQRPETAAGAPSCRSEHSERPARSQQRSNSSTGGFGRLVALLLVCALLGAGYWKYDQTRQQQARAAAAAAAMAQQPGIGAAPRSLSALAAPVASAYRCDGRQHCSQMTSCAEAKFFLKNCPDPRMDGNNDGVPCEQQWCTGPLGN